MALLRNQNSRSEAYELLRFLTEREAARDYGAAIGAFSAGRDWMDGVFSGAESVGGAFRAAFAASRLQPNLAVMATLEQIFERSMERLIHDILRRRYREEALRQELLYTAAEMDYILNLNA